jgi:hypothetical protein
MSDNARFNVEIPESIARNPILKKFLSSNDNIIVSIDNKNIEKLDFLSSKIVYHFIDYKITHSQLVNYFLTTPLLGDTSLQSRKEMGYSSINGLRNGNNISENRLELFLDFLHLELNVVDRIDDSILR